MTSESADLSKGDSWSHEVDRDSSAAGVEVSVVMPCLNEADTLAQCIEEIQRTFRASDIRGEIVVADNGSTDSSPRIAAENGARVVRVGDRGYGNALMGGIRAARGRYVIMGDADGSYDFSEIPRFLERLRQGDELVQGCRLPGGGGRVMPGAMPLLHRWLGNPVLSHLTRLWFRTNVRDVHCGLRGFVRDLPERIGLQCSGMEFATEMIVKASFSDTKIGQVPITLRPDGRIAHRPHLRTFRDGWRHLRFMLLYSPRWLFLIPGLILMALGVLAATAGFVGLRLGSAQLDVHTLLFGALGLVMGYQAVWFALLARAFGTANGLLPESLRLEQLSSVLTLERGAILGLLILLAGLVLLAGAVLQWERVGFGELNYSRTMRWVIPGSALATAGLQTIFGSFFMGILGLQRA